MSWLLLLVALPLAGCVGLAVCPPALGDRLARLVGVLVSGAALAVAVVVAVAYDTARPDALDTDSDWIPALGVGFHLGVDGISLPLVLLTALLTFLCLLYTVGHLPAPGRPRAFVAVVLLIEAGMLGTFVALDLLVFFVFFEVVLVPMWFLIAVWGGAGRRPAADKFILYTLLGSAVMLLGFLLVGLDAGSFDLADIDGSPGLSPSLQLVAFLAMGLGFAVKAPMWPLHSWLPDAHTAAPTVGSVLLAGVLLKMGTYGFVRIALPVAPEGAERAAPWLAALGVVGILYGGLACLAQRDLKRLIAFSSVGHMGFVLLGIATLTPAGINGALYANIGHGLITGLLFFLVGAIKDRHGSTDLDDAERLGRGLYARAPVLGALLAFAAVASLGLPGLAGFWGEMLALLGAYQPSAGLDVGAYRALMVLGGLGTVLAAAYLLRMVRRVNQGVPAGPAVPDASALELAAWGPLVALVVVLGIAPGLLLGLTDPAVRLLSGGGP
jgi:NADH-quinone oxidoreductase subunit M